MIFSNQFFKSNHLWALFLLLPALFVGSVYFGGQNNSAAAVQSPDGSKFAATFSAKPESLRNLTQTNKPAKCANAVPTSMDVTFDVSGLNGAVDKVAVQNLSFDPNFKWGANLSAVLISPNGTASQTLFGDPTAKVKKCGQEISLDGQRNYILSNESDQSVSVSNAPENSQLNLNSAFKQINDVNGTWILRLTDNAGGTLGTVSGVSLSIATSQTVVKRYVNVDFDGDKKSDYVVIRPDDNALAANSFAAAAAPMNFNYANRYKKLHHRAIANNATAADNNLTWYSSFANSGSFSSAKNGDVSTDTPVPADYDGDGKTDVAVWRPLAENDAAFYIIQSATNTVRIDHFGNEGDDPRVTADYDGDGKADPATFRCPPSGNPGPCYYYYRGSLNNPNNTIYVVPWGYGTNADALYPYPGDFDGDGKADFCLQRENPSYPGLSQFVLLKSSDYKYEFINWGLITDTLVPGDFDGDGKTDFGLARVESVPADQNERLSFYILTRAGGGTGNSPIRFGDSEDYIVPGDYDGDGKTDIAVFRQYPDSSDPTPDQSKFIVYKSSDKGVIYYPWGKPGDFPAAVWQVTY